MRSVQRKFRLLVEQHLGRNSPAIMAGQHVCVIPSFGRVAFLERTNFSLLLSTYLTEVLGLTFSGQTTWVAWAISALITDVW